MKHWHKGSGESIDRISGSHGFTDIVRSVVQLVPDEENDQLILSSDKNNYGQKKPSFAFKLDTVAVPTRDGDPNLVGRAIFLGESEVRVEDILRRESEKNLGDINQKILEYIRAVGEATPEQVASSLGIESVTARKYLSRLSKNGFLEKPYRGHYSVDTLKTDVTTVASVTKETQVTLGTGL